MFYKCLCFMNVCISLYEKHIPTCIWLMCMCIWMFVFGCLSLAFRFLVFSFFENTRRSENDVFVYEYPVLCFKQISCVVFEINTYVSMFLHFHFYMCMVVCIFLIFLVLRFCVYVYLCLCLWIYLFT